MRPHLYMRYARVLFIGLLIVLGGVSALVVAPEFSKAQATDVAARRAQLEGQLAQLEKDMAANQAVVDKLNAQGKSLSSEVQILNAQIKKAQLQVQATQVAIKQLGGNISVHTKTITTLTNKLTSEKQSLAQILRDTDAIDHASLVEVAFSSSNVSDFFGDLDSYASIKTSLGHSYEEITGTKQATLKERDALEEQLNSQMQLSQLQLLAKQKVVDQQTQKQTLLTQTKGQESAYQEIIKTQAKTAGQIRAELFALAGGSGSISLPIAISLAKTAGAATGVRPALILGILKQETNIGQNVGNCLVTDLTTGNGKGKNTGTPFSGVMKPSRDGPLFAVITGAIGLNWATTPVSCPQAGGYGGAMGPSQFIPSTWACYAGYVNTTTGTCSGGGAGPWTYSASKDRIAKLAGHPDTPSNPYNNLDAFTATAMLMADNGATAQTRAAERLAAIRYYAGWGGASNPAYGFYGDGVMGFADQFQADIQTLSGS